MDSVARRAVFLDRDGVLNRAHVRNRRPYPPRSICEMEILPGSAEACDLLRASGFTLVVVTNQPDVARGTQSIEEVDAIHRVLRDQVSVDDIAVCPHDDSDGCACRKPRPGLLLAAATTHSIDLASSYMVGDRWRDIEAGQRAGCQTIFIECGYDEQQAHAPDAVVASLLEAAHWIRRAEGHDREADVG